MKNLKFHKMEGAGNDFVVIDNRNYNFELHEIIKLTPELCSRKFGIGADGVLFLEKPQKPGVDYTMIYRNADGSDAGMCGNGARCLVYFAFKNGYEATQTFNVHDNIYKGEVEQDNTVSIHFPVEVKPSDLDLEGYELVQADAATEHLVTFVDKETLDEEDKLVRIGRKLRYHKDLDPPGTNVNYVHIDDKSTISLQTYERGVENLTLACGTGAMASAIATHHHNNERLEAANYTVQVKGGTLQVSFDFDTSTSTYHHLILKGPAHFVFEGSIDL